MQQEILVYNYRNRKVNSAIYTENVHLDEIVLYVLCEKLILGPSSDFELDDRMLEYLSACLHVLDQPNIQVIYAEIRKRVIEISSDFVYQSLLNSGELYMKYDYHCGKQFSKINLYPYPTDPFEIIGSNLNLEY